MREANGFSGSSVGARRPAPAVQTWGAPQVDWSTHPTAQQFVERGVNPRIAAYLAQKEGERAFIAQVIRMGGPGEVGRAYDPYAVQREQAQRQETAARERQHRIDEVEGVVATGAELGGAAAHLVAPQAAIAMTAARLAIHLIDPSGSLGL